MVYTGYYIVRKSGIKTRKRVFKTGVVTKVIYFFVISVANVLYLTKRCKRKIRRRIFTNENSGNI